MAKKELSPIEMILDEKNTDNVVLIDEDNNQIEFEQIATVVLDEKLYVMLAPVDTEVEDVEDLMFFVIDERDDEDVLISLGEKDQKLIDRILDQYYKLLEESGVDVEID